MKFSRGIGGLIAGACLVALTAVKSNADTSLWNQSFDGTGNAYASQNDTIGFGNFATVYDNFTLGSAATVQTVNFTGEYFNGSQAPITAFTVNFYDDNAGTPGGLLSSFVIPGTANETSIGDFGGFPTFTYSAGVNFAAAAGTQYWVSMVPDLGFPPQWGNSSGTGGDGQSYQDFFGARSQLGTDMAFELRGSANAVPEPGMVQLSTLVVLGGLGMLRLRRKS